MFARLVAALAAAVVVAAVAGCGSTAEPTPTGPATPASYVSAVEELLAPPAQMASLATARAERRPDVAAPSERQVDELVERARRELGEFGAQRLEYAALNRQRDALLRAYRGTITHMERVGRSLVQDDRDALRRALPPLLTSMRGLSSAVSSPQR